MKLTIQDQSGVNDLIYRVLKLTSVVKPKWGTMNVTEMLKHCNANNTLILNGLESSRNDSFKQNAFKLAFLYLPVNFPKNVKAPKTLRSITDKETPQNFEKEKELFIELISRFPAHEFPLKLYHPSFGNLKPKEWGVLNWMHLDHHLRQFGV